MFKFRSTFTLYNVLVLYLSWTKTNRQVYLIIKKVILITTGGESVPKQDHLLLISVCLSTGTYCKAPVLVQKTEILYITMYMYMFYSFLTQAEFAQCKMGLFEKQKQLLMQEKRRYLISIHY